MAIGPTHEVLIATLKQRIRDIDQDIVLLRERQKGLEQALSIALGEAAVVERGKEVFNG